MVQRLEPATFGHHDHVPTVQHAPATEHSSRSVSHVPPVRERHWKQEAARLATRSHDTASSGWQQHKDRKAVDSQIADLKHAQGALGYLEERAANKLQADIDEVDHLIVRRHLLTDRRGENAKDIATLDSHVAALQEVEAKVQKKGASDEVHAINDEISQLKQATITLRGKAGEVQELNADIDATTADGRKMDAQVRRLSRERAAIGRQVRVLTQEGDELLDSEETARDFEAFEKAGYDDVDDKDDPYLQEAAAALEKASGWNKDKLDEEAVKRREIMTSGMGANPGQALKALRSIR